MDIRQCAKEISVKMCTKCKCEGTRTTEPSITVACVITQSQRVTILIVVDGSAVLKKRTTRSSFN